MKKENGNAVRLDKIIKSRWPTLTQRQIEEIIDHGLVLNSHHRLKKGDKFPLNAVLNWEPLVSHLEKMRKGNHGLEVDVVHEESDWIAIDKPAGMASQALSLFDEDTVTNWALSRYPQIASRFLSWVPEIVPHRLDSGTSGLLIVCLTPEGFADWRNAFSKKKIRKTYLAEVWGSPPQNSFEISYSVAHDFGDSKKRVCPTIGVKYREPVLSAQTLVTHLRSDSTQGTSLLEVTCYTGVTHQVRVHLSAIRYPLVGDSLYDPHYENRPYQPKHHRLRAVRIERTGYEPSILELKKGERRSSPPLD